MYFPLISVGAGTKGVELAFARAVRQARFNVPPSLALFVSVDDDSQTSSSTTAVDEDHMAKLTLNISSKGLSSIILASSQIPPKVEIR